MRNSYNRAMVTSQTGSIERAKAGPTVLGHKGHGNNRHRGKEWHRQQQAGFANSEPCNGMAGDQTPGSRMFTEWVWAGCYGGHPHNGLEGEQDQSSST